MKKSNRKPYEINVCFGNKISKRGADNIWSAVFDILLKDNFGKDGDVAVEKNKNHLAGNGRAKAVSLSVN